MPAKVIAVDIDDTLNNFSQTLRGTEFVYDKAYAIDEALFHSYLPKIRQSVREETRLLSTDYAYLKAQLHLQCYTLARPREDAVAFMQWLRSEGWRIVICTYRDLRRSSEVTLAWLRLHGIPHDELFTANNKVVFCRAWGIHTLIDDDPLNVLHGARHGLQVFYPSDSVEPKPEYAPSRAFHRFEEIKPWLTA